MIKIDNEQLANYIMFKLDKLENKFSEEELCKIEEIVLNPININGDYEKIDLNIINIFYNLKKILFINLNITEETIHNLSKIDLLESVYFEKCNIESIELLSNLNIKEVGFINCKINNYEPLYIMNKLTSLSIVNGNVSIKRINRLQNLKYLQLSYTLIKDVETLRLPQLEELHIDNTDIEDLSIIKELDNLQRVSISIDQYIKNKEYVKDIIYDGVIVLNENMVGFNEGSSING